MMTSTDHLAMLMERCAPLPDPLWTYSEPWLQALRVQHTLEQLQRQMYDEGSVSDLQAITHQLQEQVAQLTQLLC